jgi:hypothetical protein
MKCCGRQRAAMMAGRTGDIEESEPVWLSYAGVRAIVVKGPASGRFYRFTPGNWLRVHSRS